jgi:arabinofuranosyltransferase
MTTPTSQSVQPLSRPVVLLLLAVFLAVLVRTAWFSDDALISLRTVMNVIHGNGLTFNVGERVQTFTHPLWLALLTATYAIVGNVYYAAFLLPMVVSAWVFWRIVTGASSTWQAWLAVAVLLSSRAFVDYSTSGLENPLACLLLIVFVGVFLNARWPRVTWLSVLWALGSLIYLTRPDAILLVAPALVLACWQIRRPATVARAVLIGLAPALAWTAFAVIYYGFPFPNTAYAKLGMGISHVQLWKQGVLYLVDSLDRDPATLVVIGVALAFGVSRGTTLARALVSGMALYLLYVMSIGGDFMSGRFLAVPLLLSALVLTRLVTATREIWLVSIVAVVVLGLASAKMPLLSDSRFVEGGVKHSGVADERVYYFKVHSLAYASMTSFQDPDWDMRRPAGPRRILNTCGLMGEAGLNLGPYDYLLDECALADPLLARLPALFREEWRAGHFARMVPDGYRDSLASGTNAIQNPGLKQYYDHLALITRSTRLWSRDRLWTIWLMNTGRFDYLIDAEYSRFNGFLRNLDDVSEVRPDETAWNAPGNVILKGALAIRAPNQGGRRFLDVSLDSAHEYALVFVKGNAAVGRVTLGPIPPHRRRPGLASYTVDLPSQAVRRGFDVILVVPGGREDGYALGHLLLEGNPRTNTELYRRVAVRDGLARR